MPVRRLSLAVSPVLRFADWCFGGGDASGADLGFFLWSSWWLYLMLFQPQVFDAPPLIGMDWAPDGVWIAFVATVAGLHGWALWRPRSYRLRMVTAGVSAWYWLTIAFSLTRTGVGTGTGIYTIAGGGALVLTVYLSGRGEHRA